MGEPKCPKITIGGIPIIQQEFVWMLTPGPMPFVKSFIVPKGQLNDALAAIKSPTTLELQVTGDTMGTFTLQTLKFEKIYLLEPKPMDPYNVMWELADTRWSWRGKKMYFSYNKTRSKNEKGLTVRTPDINPASVRKQFDAFRLNRYLPWSTKGDIKFEGAPYNMLEIVEKELKKLKIPFAPSARDGGAYVVENVELEGVDIYRGLAFLLKKSRLQLGILPTGNVYVYSIDYFDTSQHDLLLTLQQQRRTGPGMLYKQNMSRKRPKKVEVLFEAKEEVRVLASTSKGVALRGGFPEAYKLYTNKPVWTDKDIIDWRVIGCENVIPAPYPIKINNREINIGEYVPMWAYLEAMNISELDIQNKWFGGRLERKVALALDKGIYNLATEQFVHQLLASIRTHYRQTYQLEPFFMDRIRSWEARRVAVLDNHSRYSPPSPAFLDYCIVPKLRHPSIAKRKVLGGTHAYNWEVSFKDPLRNQPTLHSISVISQPLGIFRVTRPPLIDQVIKEIFPSALTPLPIPALTSKISNWVQCKLKASHTFETIISVVWDVDKASVFGGPFKFFSVPIDFSTLGGTGPDIEYLSRLEFARYPAREVRQKSISETSPRGIINEPNFAVNEKILEALATSEAAKLMNQYIDRVSGVGKFAGFLDIELMGHMQSIVYSFSAADGLETILDMRGTPTAPSIENIIDQRQLDYLFRHVSRGASVNEAWTR